MRRLGVPRFGRLGDYTPLIAPRESGILAFRMSSQGIVTDEGTFCLRDCIDKCRTLHSVIRVVRTSTTEVDRRKAIRHQIDLPCRLNVHGHAAYTARVTDISEGGASIRDGPSLPAGTRAELGPALAGHMDVDALQAFGIGHDAEVALGQLAAESVMRTRFEDAPPAADWFTPRYDDLDRILAFTEMKTIWHPARI